MAREDRSDDERYWVVYHDVSDTSGTWSSQGAKKWYSEMQAESDARRIEEKRGGETKVVDQWESPDPEEVLGDD